MKVADYEKLGVFYLGSSDDNAVLYDSADLTTHATIIGMTGSGKTGLGVGLIEEAAMDGIPVIAIDPKGDLANLKLRFADLRAEDFKPWLEPARAEQAGMSLDEFAQQQANLWQKGLAESGQEGRIARLLQKSKVNLYTPGLSAGQPISVLGSLAVPPAALKEDGDLYAERIEVTATSLLTLIGQDADPLADPEHILLANIIQNRWDAGENIALGDLISLIEAPPFDKIGVVSLEKFYPQNKRRALAMRINALLAAPSFAAWLEGVNLDIGTFLYQDDAPCVSVMQIAHLSDSERMFFVCLLLNELIGWMRKQKGTASLRAVLYIDEMFGYMPPNANPPSKKLLLTLLKQARAFGIGVVLSSQNPVDLDYKGLANCGTWFLGRMQTQQDRDRVLDGLEGSNIPRATLDKMLAGLDKRQFLLHNVHERAPHIFNTRWCMSYLAGPISQKQAIALCQGQNLPVASKKIKTTKSAALHRAPAAETGVNVKYLNPEGQSAVYLAELYYSAELAYISKTYGVDSSVQVSASLPLNEPLAFEDAEEIQGHLSERPLADASYENVPPSALVASSYKIWQRQLVRHLRLNQALTLYKSQAPKLVSTVDESRADFIARVQHARREQNDAASAKIKARYSSKFQTLEQRLLRAQQALEREQAQKSSSTLDTVVSIGTGILGAVFGRKLLSAKNINSASRAIKNAGRAKRDSDDIARAEQNLAKVQEQISALEQQFNDELAIFERDQQGELVIEELKIRARQSDIAILELALLYNGG